MRDSVSYTGFAARSSAKDDGILRKTQKLPSFGMRPHSLLIAMARGALGRCPACDAQGFFPKYLKPVLSCATCSEDWSHQQADDFPAYAVILIVGHLMAPAVIAVQQLFQPPIWVQMVLWVTMASMSMIVLLQPVKGAIIAIQWWFSMHGFTRSPHHEDEEASMTCQHESNVTIGKSSDFEE